MATTENLNDFYQENKKLLNEYLETRLQIFKLSSVKVLSKTISMLVLICIISFMFLFFLLFLVIAFSWFMADVLGSNAMGFLCGGAIFLIIILISIIFRNALFVNPFIRLFIHSSLSDEEEDEDEY